MNFLKIPFMCSRLVVRNFDYSRFCTYTNNFNSIFEKRVDFNRIKLKILHTLHKKSVKPDEIEAMIRYTKNESRKLSNKAALKILNLTWAKFCETDLPLSTEHFNLVFENYAKIGTKADPVLLISALKKKNLAFSNVTLNHIFKAYCHLGEPESALKVMSKMQKVNMKFESMNYGFLIGGFIRSNNPQKAEEYFRIIESKGILWTFRPVYFIASSYASVGDLDNCIKMFSFADYSNHNNEKLSSEYDALVEFILSGASTEQVQKFIRYLSDNNQFKGLVYGIQKLNRHGLFDYSMKLLENSNLKLDQYDWRNVLSKFINVDAPPKYVKQIMTHLEKNSLFIGYILPDLKPFDFALSTAESHIKYKDVPVNKVLFESLITNALSESDHVNAVGKVLQMIGSRVHCNIYNSLLVSDIIKVFFHHFPEASYFDIIHSYAPIDPEKENNFIFSCILHTLIKNGPSSAEEIYKNYFGNTKTKCNIHFEFVAATIFSEYDRNVDNIFELILAVQQYLSSVGYQIFVRDILSYAMRGDLQMFSELLEFVYGKSGLQNNMDILNYLKNDFSCDDNVRMMINKYTDDSRTSVAQ